MIEENIYNFLIADSSITALVGRRIHWINDEQGTAYPKITFKCMSKPKLYQATDEWRRYRFFVYGEDKYTVQNIADTLTSKLHGLYGEVDGVYIDFMSKLDEIPPELREDSIYEMYLDFRVKYH